MNDDNHIYISIDLKSFYASVECQERGLDPLTTNLVVADESRTEKTICLAVSPSLKAYGIPGRPRLFEVVQKVKEINAARLSHAPGHRFVSSSIYTDDLADASVKLDYMVATPRMAKYMEYSTKIYGIYLRYIAPEDIHVYSIDEVFMDVTSYLNTYRMTPHELAKKLLKEVLDETGITATAGIGTNLYLAKIAMDIMAKHVEPDEDGVRIAWLDERSYREHLWGHRPLTDFWRVGKGYAKKLEASGIYTMGDIARCSIQEGPYGEDLLYDMFGVNAELLIDHAWGWEPCTIAQIKSYRPESKSIGSGQVLHCPYDYDGARLIVREMTDLLVLDLVDKKLMTDSIVLTIGYDVGNLTGQERKENYRGPVTADRYGRRMPKHAHGTVRLESYTSSTKKIMDAVMELYGCIVDRNLLVRRITISADNVLDESVINEQPQYEQLDLFTDYEEREKQKQAGQQELDRERRMQEAVLDIKKKFGKNAVLKGMNLEKGATAMDRNSQVGGHRA